ncbi:hypothetical protein DRQ26_05915, partial [bacterium]
MSNNDIEKYMKMNYPISFVFEDDSYFVWYEDLPGCQADGETLEEAISNLETVKRDWIELALDRGMKIPKPGELSRYSGKLLLRLPLDLHKRIVMAARINRVSINTYIVKLLSEALAAKVFSTGDKQKNIFDIYDVVDIEGISKKFS